MLKSDRSVFVEWRLSVTSDIYSHCVKISRKMRLERTILKYMQLQDA